MGRAFECIKNITQKIPPARSHPLFYLHSKLHLCIWHRMISTKIFNKWDSTPY